MKRRDFLLFRTEGSARCVDLSCQQLFVHYLDLCSGYAVGQPEAGTLDETDWWAGEPPLTVASGVPEEFFRSVQAQLLEADRVRVLEMEWLAQDEFRMRVETLLAAFRAAGGEIEYVMADKSRASL